MKVFRSGQKAVLEYLSACVMIDISVILFQWQKIEISYPGGLW